jgi:hypothetical protein
MPSLILPDDIADDDGGSAVVNGGILTGQAVRTPWMEVLRVKNPKSVMVVGSVTCASMNAGKEQVCLCRVSDRNGNEVHEHI